MEPTLILSPASLTTAGTLLLTIVAVATVRVLSNDAGKRTLTNGLRSSFEAAHRSVATLAFPRYGHSVEADLAAEVHPALTTVRLPYYEMGQWAARHLFAGWPSLGLHTRRTATRRSFIDRRQC